MLSSESPRQRLLNEVADLAGRVESLVEHLKRHAEICAYLNIKAGLQQIAVREGAHLKALKAILADNRMWPRPPEPPSHEGSSNWERLGRDLELLADISRLVNREAVNWEPVDEQMAQQFSAMYAEAYDNTSLLRDLALKCDPHAID
ncbi:MAG: hypothetical protein WA005_17355 [Candidatus Binataceae bacterium]